MRFLIALLALSLPAFASTVTCTGSDASAIQASLNSGGTTTLVGSCNIGTTTIGTAANGTTLTTTTGASVTYTGSAFALAINNNSVTVTNITWNGGGLHTTQTSTSTPQTGLTITGNTIQNITMANDNNIAILGDGYWSNGTISNNTFNTITSVPVGQITTSTNVENCTGCAPGTPDNYPCSWSGGTNNCFGSGITNVNGLDNMTIQNNHFDTILGNAMSLKFAWTLNSIGGFNQAANNNWSYNKGVRLHRMFEESGGTTAGQCPGGCSFGAWSNITNWKIAGNFATFLAPYGETYMLSVPNNATAPQLINNTGAIITAGGAGFAYEDGNRNELFQGNVASVNTGLTTWGQHVITSNQALGYTVTQQNNILFGPVGTLAGQYFGTEGPNSPVPPYGGTVTKISNITGGNCSGSCDGSTLATAFITTGSPSSGCTANAASFPTGGNGTWCTYATDQLSIVNVQYSVDGTPVVTQEIQDLSSTFTSDARWQYHATINTSSLSGGSHTITALTTDVSGATSSHSQTFTTGSGPGAVFTSSTLAFGVLSVGVTSSPQTNTLTNNGSTNLTISSAPSVGGANPGDFAITGTTCGGTLAASATCTITVTFTPTVLGNRTAQVMISDNAAGSPHSFQLTGGASLCLAGNIISQCNFPNGPSSLVTGGGPWGFNGGSFATVAVDNSGPGASFAAHITVTSPISPGSNVELFQDGLTFPANGHMAQATLDCDSTRSQPVNILGILSVSPFTSYGLSWMPTFPTSYGAHPNCSSPFFKIVGSPTAGSGRVTAQADNSTTGDQIFMTNVNVVDAGSVPASQLSVTSASFTPQAIGTTQTGSAITITNGGIANLVISGITSSGDFGQTNTCSTVTPGSTCTITPTFTPTTSGSRIGSIAIVSNDSSVSPQTISLSGTGTGSNGITIDSVGYIDHSVAQIIVNSVTPLSGNSGAIIRTRSAISPFTCVGGTGGLVQPMEVGPTFNSESAPGNVINVDVAGLNPATMWNICPEFSYDSGSTWTSGVGTTVITTALPAVHPALPIAPTTFDTTFPNTSSFAADHTITSGCVAADVGAAYANAVARQATQGTLVFIPHGTVCGPTGNFAFSLNPPDVNTWLPSNVNVSTSQITLGNSSGLAPTLQVGDGVRFARSFKANVTYPSSTSCEFGNGLVTGTVYYIATVSAGNIVTLQCPPTVVNGVSTPGPTMVFTDQGTNTATGFYWVPANRILKPIIFLSDGNLPPAGITITPAWASQLWTLQSPLSNMNLAGAGGAVLSFTDPDANNEKMVSNLWIAGTKITTVDSPEAHTSSDPTPYLALISSAPFDDHIVLDRDLISLPDTPNRINTGLTWAGYGAFLQNSYLTGISYYHSEYTGLVGSLAGHVATFTGGVENMGSGNITVPPFAATFGGTGTGQAFAGLDMTNSNALTVWVPSGSTVTCSPACAQKTQTGTVTGSCLNVTPIDAWQKDSSGNPTVGEIACIPIAAGTPTSIIAAQPWVSLYDTEGSNFGLLGLGPGPIGLLNNFASCTGLCWHADDGGGTGNIRGDYTYSRNYFLSDFKYMFNPSNPSANPLSNGLGYYMRQPIEWKGGRRIRFHGNIVDGNWNEVEASAGGVLFTSVNGMGITDVDVTNNTFMHGPGVVSLAFVTAGSNFKMTPPVLRYRLKNNVAWDIGNPNFFAGRQAQLPPGWIGEGPNATQDVRIENNSIVGNSGTNPAVMWSFDTNTEGILVANNFFYINSTNQGLAQDGSEPNFGGCPSLTGKAFADCKFTPNYQWQNNLMIGNGQTPSAVAAAWPTLPNYFQTGSSSLFTVGWSKYLTPSTVPFNGNPNGLSFPLSFSSLWKAGSSSVNDHSGDVGADIDVLNAAQGLLQLGNVTFPSGVPTISYYAADSQVCYVLLSTTNDISTTTPIADAGGARARSVTMTGLPSQITEFGWVVCPGNPVMSQRSFSFKTH
jgi:hypothetical protein